MPIGNAFDAALALTRPRNYFFDEGSERACYLIRGVIYKVNLRASGRNSNLDELDTYRYLCRQPFPRHITTAQLTEYDVAGQTVVAAEYIQGQNVGECTDAMVGLPCAYPDECMPLEVSRRIQELGICDLSYGNVMRVGDRFVIVDMEG